jgi:hypothetical protein
MKSEKIIEAIQKYNGGQIKVEKINNFVIKLVLEDASDKYIIFEPANVFRNIDDFLFFIDEVKTVLSNIGEENELMRLPFFAGCSGYDLGYFIFGKNITIDKNIDFEIDFNILPADFNLNGLRYFTEYMDYISKLTPVFKSNNNFSAYIEYFLNKIKDRDWKINLVLPTDMQIIFHESAFYSEIFDLTLDKYKESK